MPITVAETADHRPLFVTYLGEELKVTSIDQWWQVDAEWWEHRPVSASVATVGGESELLLGAGVDNNIDQDQMGSIVSHRASLTAHC